LARFPAPLRLIGKAILELGPSQLGLYGLYRLGLRSGYFRWQTSFVEQEPGGSSSRYALKPVLVTPSRQELNRIMGEAGYAGLLNQADEIVAGGVRLFGGELRRLDLQPPEPQRHWTAYELDGLPGGIDLKDFWEPARFGWVYTLGRAYYLSGEERYAEAFWGYTLEFMGANPPYMGLNWISAQEAAMRLIALVFAAQVFADSPQSSRERMEQLGWLVACHARRIPPTLVYALAQNNNHLLAEAAGLFTAGLALPNHPRSAGWRSAGWRWFNYGLQTQIQPEGAYTQHSTNYQRVMLQLALWMAAIAGTQQMEFPSTVQGKLQAATQWLIALLDPPSGGVPNLGPNDGAYFLPLTSCPFADYRPVLQAAALEFLDQPLAPAREWDEMSAWLVRAAKRSGQLEGSSKLEKRSVNATPLVLVNQQSESWAYLRAARFTSRPGHADQLHLDLWWQGMNIAQDAGTYLYNAPKPWGNSLARTAVHNTLTINGEDQMLPAGRFLWLDWANSRVLSRDQAAGDGTTCLVAEHDGYRRFGMTHRRSVEAQRNGNWIIEDRLIFSHPEQARRHLPARIRLHWLAPDWPWRSDLAEEQVAFELESPHGWMRLIIYLGQDVQTALKLEPLVVRAGEKLAGPGEAHPTWGWASPWYGAKIPALSLSVTASAFEPVTLISAWQLTEAGVVPPVNPPRGSPGFAPV